MYYFEVSGDLNHQLSNQAFPAYEGAWEASELAGRIVAMGERDFALAAAGAREPALSPAAESNRLIEELRQALARPAGLPGLAESADRVLHLAWSASEPLATLDEASSTMWELRRRSDELRVLLDSVPSGSGDRAASAVLHSALSAASADAVDEGWERYAAVAAAEQLSPEMRELAENNNGVFAVRQSWLATSAWVADQSAQFDERAAALRAASAGLLDEVSERSSVALAGPLSSFDGGRVLLFGISAVSVLLATLVAWLWVGNMVVRRLRSLSGRMRTMAAGDLDTPVPEVGADEIGELAGALEVFRQQALEVQRLNLVERLYGELREAHEQLQGMQERLVAEEKLAALGELVSGVAHEISNPLSFVKNFSEGSRELSDELFEVLDGYREQLGEDDQAMLDDIRGELSDSLERVGLNGTRALTIVRRMQSRGVVGGQPQLTDVHSVLRRSVQLGCDTFAAEWGDFTVEPEYRFSDRVSEAAMVASDFNEAVVNLVSNACYAMRACRESGATNLYSPSLVVGTDLLEQDVAVTVWDNGTGIAEDVLPRIFDPFFTTRDGALGAGLGLPLAADVARRGGGSLEVETEFGDWTRFTLTLSLEIPVGAVAALDQRYDGDMSAVRSFGTASVD